MNAIFSGLQRLVQQRSVTPSPDLSEAASEYYSSHSLKAEEEENLNKAVVLYVEPKPTPLRSELPNKENQDEHATVSPEPPLIVPLPYECESSAAHVHRSETVIRVETKNQTCDQVPSLNNQNPQVVQISDVSESAQVVDLTDLFVSSLLLKRKQSAVVKRMKR